MEQPELKLTPKWVETTADGSSPYYATTLALKFVFSVSLLFSFKHETGNDAAGTANLLVLDST